MNLVFVSQEIGKLPSGVVTVLAELCRGWPATDRVTILMNPEHWAGHYLRHELKEKSNIDMLRMPVVLSGLWLIQHVSSFPRMLRLLLRFVCLPLTAIQSLAMLLWMMIWLRRKRISGILSHAGGWPGGMLNCWIIYAGFFIAVPHRILVIHNTPAIPYSLPERFLFRCRNWLMGKMATRIVTVSRACRKSLELEASFGRELDVIHNGLPAGRDDLASANNETSTTWNKQHPSIAFVGELHPRKGVHVLMEAFLRVSLPAELVLIGNGDADYTDELKSAAEQSKWPVHFLGFRDDVLSIYPQIDMLVLPSLNFESFGMVIVEAMRAGIPVICSDFGGMKEVVADGETGLVVAAGDVDALIAAVERLLYDSSLRARMGEKGRMRLKEKFSAGVMVKNYVDLFHAP